MTKISNRNTSAIAKPSVTKPAIAKIVACPHCKKSVQWSESSQYRPFCSKRCKLIDLGDWASETHSIPGKETLLDDSQNP